LVAEAHQAGLIIRKPYDMTKCWSGRGCRHLAEEAVELEGNDMDSLVVPESGAPPGRA
jgi:hypothetical protein